MKRLGFFTGAVLAGIGVFLFNQWRHVSDDDRLIAVLADHCLPYVQTGVTPFQDIGRAPGVYDGILSDQTLTDGGTRVLYDLRFVAHWGISTDRGISTRVCKVSPTHHESTVPVFVTNTNDITVRLRNHIADLQNLISENIQLGGDVLSLGWRSDDSALSHQRIGLLAGPGQVSNVVVTAVIEVE